MRNLSAASEEKFTKRIRRIAANIRRLRLERDLTQEDMISRCDLDRRFYQRIEAGESPNPSLKTLFRIAEALKVDIRELIG